MALARWEPFGGLTSLRRDMDRLFEDFMGRAPSSVGDGTVEPAVEVSDTPEAVVVKAQMPGVSKDHLQVDVTDDVLTLKGEMKEEATKEEKNYYRREFRYGAFARSIPFDE